MNDATTQHYLNDFQKSVDALDQSLFAEKKMELKVGFWVDSVVLKMQKATWRNNGPHDVPFKNSIFCSVWVSDGTIATKHLYYNIHALKLRELKGYKIKSRDFAAAFRARFKGFEDKWPNVSVDFGPLTLMEGWVVVDMDDFGPVIQQLALQFLEIAYIIDDLLAEQRKL